MIPLPFTLVSLFLLFSFFSVIICVFFSFFFFFFVSLLQFPPIYARSPQRQRDQNKPRKGLSGQLSVRRIRRTKIFITTVELVGNEYPLSPMDRLDIKSLGSSGIILNYGAVFIDRLNDRLVYHCVISMCVTRHHRISHSRRETLIIPIYTSLLSNRCIGGESWSQAWQGKSEMIRRG